MFKLHFLLGLFRLNCKEYKKVDAYGTIKYLSERILTNAYHVETISYSLWSAANI